MTGIINWFKTIFILEITGEIALKLVPLKYKEFIAFVMKLILVTAIIIPLLNIKKADIMDLKHILRRTIMSHRLYIILQTRKRLKKL